MPCRVTRLEPTIFAAPKSTTRTSPLARPPVMPPTRNTFSGLRSRWTMPAACAAPSAEAIGSRMRTAAPAGMGPPALMTWPSVWPRSSSMTKYGRPSSSRPKSVICTTLGWRMLAVALRLVDEAVGQLGIAAELAAQHLHREAAVERRVAHLVDVPHAALAQQRDDLVAAVDLPADERIARADRSRPAWSLSPSNGQKAASGEKRWPQVGHCRTSRRTSSVGLTG